MPTPIFCLLIHNYFHLLPPNLYFCSKLNEVASCQFVLTICRMNYWFEFDQAKIAAVIWPSLPLCLSFSSFCPFERTKDNKSLVKQLQIPSFARPLSINQLKNSNALKENITLMATQKCYVINTSQSHLFSAVFTQPEELFIEQSVRVNVSLATSLVLYDLMKKWTVVFQ